MESHQKQNLKERGKPYSLEDFWGLVEKEKTTFPFFSIINTDEKKEVDILLVRLVEDSSLCFAKYFYDEEKMEICQGGGRLDECRKLYVVLNNKIYLVGVYKIFSENGSQVLVRQILNSLLFEVLVVNDTSKLVH